MILLLDIGNTRCKWALSVGGRLQDTGVCVRTQSSAWTAALPWQRVDAACVSSVAQPAALAAVREQAVRGGVVVHEAFSSDRSGTLVNGYAMPQQLGVDRWMACVAAEALGTGSVLVADAGTALTLDFIDADSRHQGGLITPGVVTMRGALRQQTQLRPRSSREATGWLSRDTDTAIAAGTLRSAICLLDNAVKDLAPDRLLLTGGDAERLAAHLAYDWHVKPNLVLEGLALHAARTLG